MVVRFRLTRTSVSSQLQLPCPMYIIDRIRWRQSLSWLITRKYAPFKAVAAAVFRGLGVTESTADAFLVKDGVIHICSPNV